MSGDLSFNPDLADVDNSNYLTGSVSVTTTQVEAKVGSNKLTGRQLLMIQNTGNKTLYYGPSGVTSSNGMPLFKNQYVSIPVGDQIAVYLICGTGDSTTALIQELG